MEVVLVIQVNSIPHGQHEGDAEQSTKLGKYDAGVEKRVMDAVAVPNFRCCDSRGEFSFILQL